MKKDDKQLEQAVKYIAMGAQLMGWSMLLPNSPLTSHLIVGSPAKLQQLTGVLSDSYEWVIRGGG